MHADDLNLRNRSNDIATGMRKLAGSGDFMDATWKLKEMAAIIAEAHTHHGKNNTDDSLYTIGYVMDMSDIAINWMKHIPIGNENPKAFPKA